MVDKSRTRAMATTGLCDCGLIALGKVRLVVPGALLRTLRRFETAIILRSEQQSVVLRFPNPTLEDFSASLMNRCQTESRSSELYKDEHNKSR